MHTKLDQEINFIVQRRRSLSMVVFVHLRRAYPIWVKALARMKQSVVVALITAQLVLTRTHNWTHPDVPTIPTFPPITFPPISLPTPRPTPQDCSQYAHPNWYGDCVCDYKTTHVMKDDGKCYCIGYNFHSAPWACYACVCCTCLLCRIFLVNW